MGWLNDIVRRATPRGDFVGRTKVIIMKRTYLGEGQTAPEGSEEQQGPRGGRYYEAPEGEEHGEGAPTGPARADWHEQHPVTPQHEVLPESTPAERGEEQDQRDVDEAEADTGIEPAVKRHLQRLVSIDPGMAGDVDDILDWVTNYEGGADEGAKKARDFFKLRADAHPDREGYKSIHDALSQAVDEAEAGAGEGGTEKPRGRTNPSVGTEQYEWSHGKKPRGTGGWAFQFDDDEEPRFFHGSYADAKKQAIAEAREKGVGRVKTLP